jgi:hypothetical protein
MYCICNWRKCKHRVDRRNQFISVKFETEHKILLRNINISVLVKTETKFGVSIMQQMAWLQI